MSKVVDLQSYRAKTAEHRGFQPWCKRFGETYGAETRLSDLSDRALYFLARPGEETAMAFYELIMGILGMGQGLKFYYLPSVEQMRVVDIHLFLADQVRFEMMHRLGWIKGFCTQKYALLEMVKAFESIRSECAVMPPKLSPDNPDHEAYGQLTTGDKHAFVRRKLRQALEAFQAEHLS
jgi:hypothetical protein